MPYPVFHFTHRDNLALILRAGGLHCDARMAAQGGHANVGDLNIKQRRARRAVPVAALGVVADYVPFYYAPRSPMLYSISCNNVPDCPHPQSELAYLVTSTDALFEGHTCCFTDRNAVLAHARFSDQQTQLATLIDWPLMAARIWRDTPEDLSRKERRMAEFLVHQFVPWSQVSGVAVYDAQNMRYVQNVLAGQPYAPPVSIQRDWYF